MPWSWVRSSGGAALAPFDLLEARWVGSEPFALYFIRPCQSPLAAKLACIGQDATFAGGIMSPLCSTCLSCGSLISASAAYVVMPPAASAALALGPTPASWVR